MIKMSEKSEVITGLTEVLFYLAICCYSEDKEEREKVERMAKSVSDAIELLKGE